MWKAILLGNVLILCLLWLLAMAAITPAHNLLLVFAEQPLDLPILTDMAFQVRGLSGAIPLGWALLTLVMGRSIGNVDAGKRQEWLLMHTVGSLVLGLLQFFFFGLAGILPVLKIGAALG